MGKFALYGGLQVKSWDENTVDYRHYRARKDIGGLVHHPTRAGPPHRGLLRHLYRRSGNPHFDPTLADDDPRQQDNGVDMVTMLTELTKGGIGAGERNVKALAFGTLAGTGTENVWDAGALFGGVLWGADLKEIQETQLEDGQPWDYVAHEQEWGGHAIMAAGRYSDVSGTTSDRTALITWATVVDSTDAFIKHQVQERYAVIFPWHLTSKQFMDSVNMDTLAAEYQALTGKTLPIPATPTPEPDPEPTPTPTPDPEPTPDPTPDPEPTPTPAPDDLTALVRDFVTKAQALLS
jgi:hypothetical protein